MQRGELYRVRHPSGDPRLFRTFLVASRNRFLQANYASATCVPVYSTIHGLDTEIPLDERNGLKHPSAGRCDELQRMLRRDLTDYVGSLTSAQMRDLSRALASALGILPEDLNDL